MANRLSIEIDPKKFETKIIALGKSKSQIAREMGYSTGYIFDTLRRGVISESGAMLLELKHGIKLEDIVPDEPIDLEENPPVCTDLSADKLYAIIFDAVYHAFVEALRRDGHEDQT